MLDNLQTLRRVASEHPYPLLFATVSGAHLYGFPSPDSDVDLRGVHLLTPDRLLRLERKDETVQKSSLVDGVEIDLVTHDAAKFFRLMLKPNGYVLEQLFSPLIIMTSDAHDELKHIATECITRRHVLHYIGFAQNQWRLFQAENPPRVKPLLYTYRVILTGIHLMETGTVEANLVTLNERLQLPFLSELIARKLARDERTVITDVDLEFHERQYNQLMRELAEAGEKSGLPEFPTGREALDDLLIRLRLKAVAEFEHQERSG